MKKEYLILLVVIIVGLIAIFTLSFVATEAGQNLTGAWGGKCIGADKDCCPGRTGCRTQSECEACGGTWKR